MNDAGFQRCTICGDRKLRGQVWFLVAEDLWQDKLKILHWHDRLAFRRNMHLACCPLHVQELVVHWMAMGSLGYPFAALSVSSKPARSSTAWPLTCATDADVTRQIGELAVHRESIGRALRENPESLQVILDELIDALEREAIGAASELESEEDEVLAALTHQA